MIGSEEIRKKYGDYLYYRAMSIPEWYIKRTGIEVDSNGFKQVDFSVDIFYKSAIIIKTFYYPKSFFCT